jgi:preprotein translocase subunit SecD
MKYAILLLFSISPLSSAEVFRVSRVLSKQTENTVEMTIKENKEEKVFVEKAAIVTSHDVMEASPDFQLRGGGIILKLTKKGGDKMFAATGKMKLGVDRMAIIIDGKILYAPVIQNRLGRTILITLGELGFNERKALARRIKPPKK